MSAPIRVLYVEDDHELGTLVLDCLSLEGIEGHVANDGCTALAQLGELRPEVVLLDLMLPGMDGLEVCREIRTRSQVPVIVVTGRVDPDLPVKALEDGADDFVAKPFELRELVARINAQARRARGRVLQAPQRLHVGALAIDLAERTVELDGAPIQVTPTELDVLIVLAQHAGEILSRDQLLQLVHGANDSAFDRSIDVHVSRLRSKLEADPRRPRIIKTVRGVGYVLLVSRR